MEGPKSHKLVHWSVPGNRCGFICSATKNGCRGLGILLLPPPHIPGAYAAGEPELLPAAVELVGPVNVVEGRKRTLYILYKLKRVVYFKIKVNLSLLS